MKKLLPTLLVVMIATSACITAESAKDNLGHIADDLSNGLASSSDSTQSDDSTESDTQDAIISTENSSEAINIIEKAVTLFESSPSRGEITFRINNQNTDAEQSEIIKYTFQHDAKGQINIKPADPSNETSVSINNEKLKLDVPQIRYMNNIAYIQIPISSINEQDIDTTKIGGRYAWLSVDTEHQTITSLLPEYPFHLLCNFSRYNSSSDSSSDNLGCDPMSTVIEALQAATQATIAGEEEIRDTLTTKIKFKIPLNTIEENTDIGKQGVSILERLMGYDSISDQLDFSIDIIVDKLKKILTRIFSTINNLSLPDLAVALNGTIRQVLERDTDIQVDAEVWIDDDAKVLRFSYNLDSILSQLESIESPIMELLIKSQPDGNIRSYIPAQQLEINYYDFTDSLTMNKPPSHLLLGDYSLLSSSD